jgi:putative NADH-flavin reductase
LLSSELLAAPAGRWLPSCCVVVTVSRVLVRDPTGLEDLSGRVDVVTGDSRTRADLDRLVADADAVVSALGPTAKEGSLHTETATVLVEAMRAAEMTRFVGVSGAGIDVPGDQKSWSAKLISRAIQTLGGEVVKDKPAEYAVYAASDLNWTLVRPPRLVDGAPTGQLEHDAYRSTRSTKSTKITRTDLATFLADVLEQGLYARQAPFVASARRSRA